MVKIEDREEAKRRQRESNRKAVEKYQQNFKRINCRLEPALYEEIVKTGQSANSFIVEAVEEKLKRRKESLEPHYIEEPTREPFEESP